MVWKYPVRWSEKADAREIECYCQVGVASYGDCTAIFSGLLQLFLHICVGFCEYGSQVVGQAQGREGGW